MLSTIVRICHSRPILQTLPRASLFHTSALVRNATAETPTTPTSTRKPDRPKVRSLMGANTYHTETPSKIFSSETLLDRRSSFIAHVAEVHNVHEVKVVVAHLLRNKKIAKATHNILAYRITMPDGKVLQGNDDDGESAAGGCLSYLMQMLEVENVVVVVTRWFGGIPLGPDRFKNINNVARNALDDCGFINDKRAKGTNNSKHKKNNNNKKKSGGRGRLK